MTARLVIPRHRIEVSSSRSGGAGGQHVNKTSTKIELRFVLGAADWLPWGVRERMENAYANRLNGKGEFTLHCDQSRSQQMNLELAFKKLEKLILACWNPPKKRVPTKVTRSSKEKRLSQKKHHADKKKGRKALE